MKKLGLLFIGLLLCVTAHASDYHNRNQRHRIVYVITDGNGNVVTGQTPSLQIQRVSDDAIYDFSTSSFAFSGWTTRYQTMLYNSAGQYYNYTFSQDAARFNSGEYICVVSNDASAYRDSQASSVFFDSTQDVIRVNR